LVWKGRVTKKKSEIILFVFLSSIYFSSRGLIFGVWSACASVGNIVGATLAATFLTYGYEYPFLVCSVLLICCAIICFFAIVPSPKDVGLYEKDFVLLFFFENIISFRSTNTR
jgi:sugar phosphate permease